MKKKIISGNLLISMASTAILSLLIISCNKENSASNTDGNPATTESLVASLEAIAVGTGTSADSVYVIGTCARGHHTDSIALASLPATIGSYLTDNYAGYTFQKAFTDKDKSGNISGYVVIIQYNGKPVGLKFDSSGTFIQVLEQREAHDLTGHGWHRGGLFDDRDGLKRDTVTLNSLPAAITGYFSTNYPQDTLVRAYRNRDSGYVVLSINGGVFANVFDASGNFVKRIQSAPRPGRPSVIADAALPSAAESYLSSTYPNYVLKQAFAIRANGAIQGYIAFIDASGTKYAVEFDANGAVIRSITIV